MRILLVSDLHYSLKQLDWTAAVAAKFDMVVIAGDLLDITSSVDGAVQIVVILKYLKRLAGITRLIVCSGNQDLDGRDPCGERVATWMAQVGRMGIATDGDTMEVDGTRVTICPWWDGPNAKRAVRAQIERDSSRRGTSWIWVYHAPPSGTQTCWDGRHAYGDAELERLIGRYTPDLVFTGHIHQAPFEAGGSWTDRLGQTWIFNCGRQPGPTPCHIVLDTVAREVAWFSLAGAEMASLDQPLRRPLLPLDETAAWLEPKLRGPGPTPV